MNNEETTENGGVSSWQMAGALGFAVLALSTAAPFFRQAEPTHPMAAAALRLAVACVCLLPFLVRAMRRGTTPRRFWGHAGAAGIFYALHFGLWVTSLTLTTVAASVTLVTATPVLLAVWAVMWKRDEPTRRTWGALGLCVVGMVIIGGYDIGVSMDHLIGDALALGGAAAMAGYLLVARRLGNFDVLAFMAVATGAGAAVLYVACFVTGVDPRPASWEAFVFIALAALVPQLIGHNVLTWALRHTTPTNVGIATVGEPVGATILAWLWLGETIGWVTATGCVIVLVGVVTAITEREPG